MSDLNRIVLSGRLTRDPELRYTASGKAVLGFTLASNTYMGGDKDRVLFIDCSLFGNRAEALSSRLSKGQMVIVEGRLILDTWTTEDGQNRQKIKTYLDNLYFAGGQKKASEYGNDYPEDDFIDDRP